MDDLSGKTALVTGASRGIGAGIAVALAQAGANIAVNYRTHEQQAHEVVEQIRAQGGQAIAIGADVSLPEQVSELVQRTAAEFGAIDIMVNNAGVSRPLPLDQISVRDWEEILATNLTSAFLATQAVVPGMRRRKWGRVINISSVAAQVGGVVGPHYAASKAGMLGLTHAYAALLAREGITVNAIAPALVETEMVTSNPKARPELIPVGRFGKVDEVAQAAVFLARNGYVTGQTINVNGGWYMS